MPLIVLPEKRIVASFMPVATIMDNKAFVNIPPFAMCVSPANPAVISALGAPMPCTPIPTSPWVPGNPKVLAGGIPAVDNNSKLICAYGGVINITNPGQVKAMI